MPGTANPALGDGTIQRENTLGAEQRPVRA